MIMRHGWERQNTLKQKEEFFNKILLEMTVPVEDYIRHHCKDMELAEDIMQEVFLEAHKNVAKLMHHENYKGWIMLTAKNKLMKITSRERQYYERNTCIDEVDENVFSQEPEDEASELVNELLKNLTSDEAGLIRGVYLEGFSSDEMAKRLSITENAFRMRLHRAREKAKKILQKSMEE